MNVRLLLYELAKAVVDDPEAVEVESIEEPEGVVLRLRVAPQDLEEVVGRNERTSRTLKAVLASIGERYDTGRSLDIEIKLPGASQ